MSSSVFFVNEYGIVGLFLIEWTLYSTVCDMLILIVCYIEGYIIV